MDVISHWLWGIAVTHGKIKGRFSGAMGVIPDLIAFLPVMIISLFTGNSNPRVDDTTTTEDFHPLSWEIYLELGNYSEQLPKPIIIPKCLSSSLLKSFAILLRILDGSEWKNYKKELATFLSF